MVLWDTGGGCGLLRRRTTIGELIRMFWSSDTREHKNFCPLGAIFFIRRFGEDRSFFFAFFTREGSGSFRDRFFASAE